MGFVLLLKRATSFSPKLDFFKRFESSSARSEEGKKTPRGREKDKSRHPTEHRG